MGWVTGCAVVPESIEVVDESALVGYQQVASAPDLNSQKVARWGGVITKVENLPDATVMEILHFPLRGYGRPVTATDSEGRFRVYIDGFLDPMVYEKGRSVTFTGKVLGVEDGLVGEHSYAFPTIKAEGYYLWRDTERIDITSFNHYPYGGYHHWPARHRNSTIIIQSSNKRGSANSNSANRSNRPPNTRNDRRIKDNTDEPK